MARGSSFGSTPEESGSNFGVGLFVGVVAGSLGMFLFGTKQGHTLLNQIKSELKKADGEVPEVAQRLIATVTEKIESTAKEVPQEFPKFKRRLAE